MFYQVEYNSINPNILNVKVPDVSGIIEFIDTYGVADGEYINFITGKTIWAGARYESSRDAIDVTLKETYRAQVERFAETYEYKTANIVGQIDTPFFDTGVCFELYAEDIQAAATN